MMPLPSARITMRDRQPPPPRKSAIDAFASPEGKRLYCVPIERVRNGLLVPNSGKLFYVHATDQAEALHHFRKFYGNPWRFRIVTAGLCVGHFVANKAGTIVRT